MQYKPNFKPRTPEERKAYMKTPAFKLQMAMMIILLLAFVTFVGCSIMEGLGLWKH